MIFKNEILAIYIAYVVLVIVMIFAQMKLLLVFVIMEVFVIRKHAIMDVVVHVPQRNAVANIILMIQVQELKVLIKQ